MGKAFTPHKIVIPDEAQNVVVTYNMPDESPGPVDPELPDLIPRDPTATESEIYLRRPMVFGGKEHFTAEMDLPGSRVVESVRLRYWARVTGWTQGTKRLNFGWLAGRKPDGKPANRQTLAYLLYLPGEEEFILRNGFGKADKDRPKTAIHMPLSSHSTWEHFDILWQAGPQTVSAEVTFEIGGFGIQEIYPANLGPQSFPHGLAVEVGFPSNSELAALGEMPWTGELYSVRIDVKRSTG